MKIWILRHATAEPMAAGGLDFERGLTEAGRKELRAVLKAARKLDCCPDLVYTSPLRRAMETAQLATLMLQCPDAVQLAGLTPNAAPERAWREVSGLASAASRVLIVGHQPNLGRLIGYLLGHEIEVDLKKSALVCIEVDKLRGSDGTGRPGARLQWMITPKLIEKLGR